MSNNELCAEHYLTTFTQAIGSSNLSTLQLDDGEEILRSTTTRFSGRDQFKWLIASLFHPKTLKCTVVYLLAAGLFVFTPSLSAIFGSSCYLACTNIVIFNPAKTVGTMIEAGISALLALAFGTVTAMGCLFLVYSIGEENRETAHALCILDLFCSTFILAYIKATIGQRRPAVASATNTANLLMFITITRVANESLLSILPRKLAQTVFSVFGGVLLSVMGAFIFWPTTSSSLLLKSLATSLQPLSSLFHHVMATIVPEDFQAHAAVDDGAQGLTQPLIGNPEQLLLSKLLADQDKSLVALADIEHEVRHEILSFAFIHGSCYQRLIKLLERLKNHLGGMITSFDELQVLSETSTEVRRDLVGVLSIYRDTLCNAEMFLRGQKPATALRTLASELEARIDSFVTFYESHLDQKRRLWTAKDVLTIDNVQRYVVFVQLGEFGSDLLHFLRQLVRIEKLLQCQTSVGARFRDILKSWRRGSYWKTRRTPDTWTSPLLALYNQSAGHPNFAPATSAPSSSFSIAFINSCLAWFDRLEPKHLKHAFKTAATIVVLAFPAFVDEFQPIFQSWRLHWALTTAVVVMTPSVGASNIMGLYRTVGTVVGALIGWFAYMVAGDNSILRFALLAIVSLVLWALFLHSQYPKINQIALLTFTVIFLGKLATQRDPTFGDAPILWFAFQRWFAVTLGVLTGLAVTHFVWPFRARHEVRKGLSAVVFDLGLLYSRLMAQLGAPENWSEHPVKFRKLENSVRRMLAELRRLVSDSVNEPEVFGSNVRYSQCAYEKLINSCELILGLFSSFFSVLSFQNRRPGQTDLPVQNWSSESLLDPPDLVKGLLFQFPVTEHNSRVVAVLARLEPNRKSMVANVILSLYVASSCLRMQKPEPPLLPNPYHSQMQLLQQLPNSLQDLESCSSRDLLQLFFIVNILLLPHVVREIDSIHYQLRSLFGAIPYTLTSAGPYSQR